MASSEKYDRFLKTINLLQNFVNRTKHCKTDKEDTTLYNRKNKKLTI